MDQTEQTVKGHMFIPKDYGITNSQGEQIICDNSFQSSILMSNMSKHKSSQGDEKIQTTLSRNVFGKVEKQATRQRGYSDQHIVGKAKPSCNTTAQTNELDQQPLDYLSPDAAVIEETNEISPKKNAEKTNKNAFHNINKHHGQEQAQFLTEEDQSARQVVAKRQKLLSLSQAVVQRIRKLGLKQGKRNITELDSVSQFDENGDRGTDFMTGTQITNDILKQFNYFKSVKKDANPENAVEGNENDESVFKNIQRRVYDTINVLDALNVIKKHKNIILYNPNNEFFKEDDLLLKQNLNKEKKSQNLKLQIQQRNQLAQKIQEAKEKTSKQQDEIEKKQANILELMKRYIAIKKLVKRNIETAHDQLFQELCLNKDIELTNEIQSINQQDKYWVPMIYIHSKQRGPLNFFQDTNLQTFSVDCMGSTQSSASETIEIYNENHLFEQMGLTSVQNEKELELYINQNLMNTFKGTYLGQRTREHTSEEDLEGEAPQKRQKSQEITNTNKNSEKTVSE